MSPSTSPQAPSTGNRFGWRAFAVALAALLTMGFLASCGDDSGDEGSSGDSGSEESGGSDSISDDLQGQVDDAKEDLDKAVDDLKEGVEGLPDQIRDCAELSTRGASLAVGGFTGESADSIDKDADELKSLLPEDLHDEVDTIADASKTVSDDGALSSGDAMGSQEYEEATNAIVDYIESECT